MNGIVAQSIETQEQFVEALELLGYKASVNKDGSSISTEISVNKKSFIVGISFSNNGDSVLIACQVATTAEAGADHEKQLNFYYNLLDLNDQIAPFATCIIKHGDFDADSVKEGEAPVIALVDRIPLGNLSQDELRFSMDSLRRAILTTMNRMSVIVQG